MNEEIRISKKVNKLCIKRKYNKALKLLNFDTNNTILLNQKLLIYLSLNQLENAIYVYKSIKSPDKLTKKYYKNLKIAISQKLKTLCMKNKHEEAFDLVKMLDLDGYYDIRLLNRKISICKHLGKYELALETYKMIKNPNEKTQKEYEMLMRKIADEIFKLFSNKDVIGGGGSNIFIGS